MKKVFVLGSLNMDISIGTTRIPASGETLNGYDAFMNPGGKGGNQAVAAAKLGATTYMIGQVGEDAFGKQLIDALKNYGVHTSYVQMDENATSGVAMVIRCNGDNRILLGNGANHTLLIEDVIKAMDALANPGDIFLTQLECPYDIVKASLIYAKQKQLFTIINPAPARLLEDELYPFIDIVVVNQSECEVLSGQYPNDAKDCGKALQWFQQKGVQAILTLGAQGSVVLQGQQVCEIASRIVKALDTTGAGDAYIGALCAELAKGQPILEALRFASDVAGVCVTRMGAQAAIPTRQEVEEYFKEGHYE